MKRFGWLALILATQAFGYVLPSGSILRHLAERRQDLQLSALRIEGVATFTGGAAQEAASALGVTLPEGRPELSIDAAVLMKLPGRCRIEASSVETGKSVAAIEANTRRRTEGAALGALEVAAAHLCPLLAGRAGSTSEARAQLERHLSALKIDFKQTSLGRFGGQVAYVLGGTDPTRPSFWVYKDSFQPARVRFVDPQGAAWDVRFTDYTSPAAGEWFPRVLEVQKDGEPLFRFAVTAADSRVKLDDKLFAVQSR